MAISKSLAKRYAKAIVASAKSDAELDAISRDLSDLASMVAHNPVLADTLCSPIVQASAKTAIMRNISAKAGFGPIVSRLAELLISAGRTEYIQAVVEAFGAELDRKRGLVRGVVNSTAEIGAAELDGLQAALAGSLGKKVILSQRKDPALLGGLQVRVGGLIIDGSLRNRLKRIGENLNS
jgi:F-type H+-transporting ATPase subunit delta